jgi:hypothetical protein
MQHLSRENLWENTRMQWLKQLTVDATNHREAVNAAILATTASELAPQAVVDRVLKAGAALDFAIQQAFRYGATTADIAAISELHPLYVAELVDKGEQYPPVF